MKPWPTTEPTDEMVELTFPPLPIRDISDVDLAFPAQVSPDIEKAPQKYFSDKSRRYTSRSNPWILLASEIIHGGVKATKLRMPVREHAKGRGSDVWRWITACARSFELQREHKIVAVAWILESNFWAYWVEGKEPDWVLEELTRPDADVSSPD